MPTPAGRNRDTSHWQTLTGKPLTPNLFDLHKASQGRSYKDPTLAKFTTAYRAAGTKWVGAYLYLTTTATAQQQVDNYVAAISAAGVATIDFVVVDWERDEKGAVPPVSMVEEVCGLLDARFGANRVAVYSSDWVTGFSAWRTRNPGRALFYANYNTSADKPTGGWQECARWDATVWQWTSTGTDPAFTGGIDLNHVLKPAWFDGLDPIPPFDPAAGKFSLWPVMKDKPTLTVGAVGDAVRYLQGVARKWNGITTIDGKFGPRTQQAVRDIEAVFGQAVNGAVEAETWQLVDFLAIASRRFA